MYIKRGLIYQLYHKVLVVQLWLFHAGVRDSCTCSVCPRDRHLSQQSQFHAHVLEDSWGATGIQFMLEG